MKKAKVIDILTTLNPEKRNDKLLELKNPILKLENISNFNLNLFNKRNEIPKQSKHTKYLSTPYQLKNRKRPILEDYYNENLSEWIIICNSDIIFYCNLEKIIEQCEQNEIGFASARRFDTENIDLFLKNPINSLKIKRYLKNHCKFQSKRTLDLFLIKKQILKSLLSITHELGLIPGTVMFDIYLFLSAQKLTKTADITKGCIIIHKNHEKFRIANKFNLLININDRNNFVQNRKIDIKEDIYLGCLTSSDFYLNNKKMIRKSMEISKLRYKVESLRIILINKIEIILYYWNYFIFKANKQIFKKNKFSLKRIISLLILLPSFKIGASTNEDDFDSFKKYMDGKYKSYSKRIMKKFL